MGIEVLDHNTLNQGMCMGMGIGARACVHGHQCMGMEVLDHDTLNQGVGVGVDARASVQGHLCMGIGAWAWTCWTMISWATR